MPKPARNADLTTLIDRVEMVREEMLKIQRDLERRESDNGQDRKAQPLGVTTAKSLPQAK